MRTVELRLVITEAMEAALKDMVLTGLYGRTINDAAERVIARGIEERQRDSYIMPVYDRSLCPASSDGKHFPGCGCL